MKDNHKGRKQSYLSYRRFQLCLVVSMSGVFLGMCVLAVFGASSPGLALRAHAAEVDVSMDGSSRRTVVTRGTPPRKQQDDAAATTDTLGIEEKNHASNNMEEELPQEAEENPSFLTNRLPTFKYGTAWKKERTKGLVKQAVLEGFRHIDTACQPKHYNEKGVGEGWTEAAAELGLSRDQIWLQTKFTSVSGQDRSQPLPYDANAPLEEQVQQSLERSLENLQTDYLDSWIMHGPEDNWDDTLRVWRVMESYVDQGVVKQIGISNLYAPDALEYLYQEARIPPAVVQNRFYPDTGHDVDIRAFCLDHNIEYQSFWTLGANRHVWQDSQDFRTMAKEKNLTPETLFYAVCFQMGITVLDGTTNTEHMRQDIALLNRFRNSILSDEPILTDEEMHFVVTDLLALSEPEVEEDSEDSQDWQNQEY
uniref:NADP-dependent oxidoreductase domain-containing protein n=1 Tax=Attheya septentrionalis TaxID=420275 RepID=A0A7S2UAE7_9STRA|mmetsp:Transcript_17479/g.31542  ORF Transcript_17479/g.31542 Transcript_17479/m.31542 type:complete len:422 (+) Transcript_17479:126-1391(+)